MPITLLIQNAGGLGGGYEGIAPTPVHLSHHDSQHATSRSILRRGWNGLYTSGNVPGNVKPKQTPFRIANNAGDYLSRTNYVCGGSNQVNASKPGWKSIIGNIMSNCDGTNIAASVTNNKWVYDSSDYTNYRRLKAIVNNYNDSTSGGDDHNGSASALMRVRRR